MAELERDNTFLKLQIQKETMKNDLEKLRANYRQARLDEIAKREDVVRTRIQWWQEQEKIRQDLEAQRIAAENIKSNAAEEKAAKQAIENEIPKEVVELEEAVAVATETPEPEEPPKRKQANYSLVGIHGTRSDLSAKIKNKDTGRLALIHIGDTLSDGTTITDITPSGVGMSFDGSDSVLTFDEI